ncbi:MAG TPA: hypothetical protein VHQ66_00215 [Myxococcota bacterium]|jgi:hypothetical protein|nr:hypothetical protein [Myxococcota bacterium]
MRLRPALLSASLLLAASAAHAELDSAAARALLEQSQREKKGVTIFVPGHAISIVVTSVSSDSVEGRNQEYQRVVIDPEEILAVALP